ncbi:MAG: outer rane beta-barrel protein [Chitinophagaceae bacterium]|nr:outer rane beta-barrel protein [Chitinophagaceae bacterium]
MNLSRIGRPSRYNSRDKMKKLLPLILFSVCSFALNAQSISGLIKDADEKPLANATVSLLRSKDSSVAKLAVTNKEGRYIMSGIKEGKYLVTVSHVGFAMKYSSLFDVTGTTEIEGPSLSLVKSGSNLGDVTVTGRKQLVEVKADKTIFNVEGTINAVGQDALELLRKAPGVQIDRDDNISISGKNGVQVFIDGKPSPLAGKDLSEYLKTLQSAQIESIEIITNPSAKYEAAGNAGIINIRLKRNKTLGTNGSVNAGYGIGIYSKYNAGIAINHRSKTLNLFGTYNHNRARNESPFNLYREVADSIFDQHSKNINRNQSHNFKVGADFLINRFNTIGVLLNGVRADPRSISQSNTMISYLPTKAGVKQLSATNNNVSRRDNTNYNINFKHSDTAGRDLNIDVDHSVFDIITDQLLTNIYLNASGTAETSREVNNMVSPTEIRIYSGKVDYEQHLNKGRFGIGGKTSIIRTDNDFQRYNIVGSTKDLDKDKSNRFRYNENINAAYLNYNKQLKGWMYQVGVRMENTVTEGRSTGLRNNGSTYVPFDSSFKRDYTNLFPSAAVTFNKNPRNQWSLSYSRRIDRPAYQDLNPFEFKLDAYTYMKGNTELTPQFTHALSVTNIYKFKLTTSLSYSHTEDVFAQITDVIETSKSFLTKKNLATQDNIGLNISFPFSYKNYSLFTNVNAFYSKYQADLGPMRKIDVDVFSYRVFAQNSLKLGKTTTAELSGWINGPGLWGGTFKTKIMGQMDLGLQQTVLKGMGTLRFALSDVLKTFRFDSDTNFAGQYLRAYGSSESRVFRINFSYRFGSTQVKAARNRKTGSEDENNRANGGGGGLGGN